MWIAHPSAPTSKADVTPDAFTSVWQGLGWVATSAPPGGTVDPNDQITRDELNTGPGAEALPVGYAERTTDFTTTNTASPVGVPAAIISDIPVTVLGTGRAVQLKFICGGVRSSVANNFVNVYFLVSKNGGAEALLGPATTGSSPSTTTGRGLPSCEARPIVPAGETWVFRVGVQSQGGTATIGALPGPPAAPMFLQAVYQ